jgi:hypothetical protein
MESGDSLCDNPVGVRELVYATGDLRAHAEVPQAIDDLRLVLVEFAAGSRVTRTVMSRSCTWAQRSCSSEWGVQRLNGVLLRRASLRTRSFSLQKPVPMGSPAGPRGSLR